MCILYNWKERTCLPYSQANELSQDQFLKYRHIKTIFVSMRGQKRNVNLHDPYIIGDRKSKREKQHDPALLRTCREGSKRRCNTTCPKHRNLTSFCCVKREDSRKKAKGKQQYTSPGLMVTGSPKSTALRSRIPIFAGSPQCTGLPWAAASWPEMVQYAWKGSDECNDFKEEG